MDMTPIQQAAYSIGISMGQNLNSQGLELDFDKVVEGLSDSVNKRNPKLTPEQMSASFEALEKQMKAKAQEHGAVHIKLGEEYLAANAKKEGVQTTDSGLQYKIVTQGEGKMPTAEDTVVVHYTGTFIDGNKFDSSHDRGQPAEFPLNGVIPGWTEGLQLLSIGGKAELTIPGDLAYGPQGRGEIPPSATLLFEVELLEIK
ncbi:MAG: FKBP-type peptidyl-prolyl cis-trans isomerase [Phycisphaeraceae bacterium]|nr:FKBP-type peptidyl-prolyl cis-trans isomerase [Phycisphaeraceae bacterium]